MKDKKKLARIRRSTQGRRKMVELKQTRLTVFRSNQHIYAQIIDSEGKIIAAASSLDKELKGKLGSNINAAVAVGKMIAERAQKKGLQKVAFDRSGYRYHGRVSALADSAREAGLTI